MPEFRKRNTGLEVTGYTYFIATVLALCAGLAGLLIPAIFRLLATGTDVQH
jgi:hypothetical protein